MSSSKGDTLSAELPVSIKKPRKPRAKKGEIKLQSRLEKYQTVDSLYPNCWIVYKKEKQELLAEEREEKKKRKEKEPKIDQIRGLLSEASRMKKWSETLQEQGREPQAEGVRNAADRAIQEACKIFHDGLPDEEKEELDENEIKCLTKEIVPPYPYLCSKSDLRDMEAQRNSLQITEMQKKICKYEKMIEEEQAFAQELIREIVNTLPFVKNEKQLVKLKRILEQVS